MTLGCRTSHGLRPAHSPRRNGIRAFLLALSAIATAAPSPGADEEPKSTEADRRMQVMREGIEVLRTTSTEIESKSALKFVDRPLLRYQDQSRETGDGVKGVLDASVWRLGDTGRPRALVTLELYPVVNESKVLLAYEFISLSPQAFEMQSSRGAHWKPHGTELSMAALDDAPPPAATPRGRLVQMRELARRFSAQEEFQGQRIVCRLLPQPIDRYDDKAAGIVEGAIFVFANGTNPEVGLLLECSDRQWSYGAFRLTSATIFVQLDGKTFLEATWEPGDPIDAPYTGVREWVALPE